MNYPHVIVITGATASGKSAVALDVARRLGAHIISADSRQMYRGIPIITAAPTEADRALVPHHLVECLDLTDYYSAAMFEADACRLIDQAAARGDRYVVVCGGSMMYVDALLYGIDELPTISPDIRARVLDILNSSGKEAVLALLDNLDPEYAARIDRDNTRRIVHAVEICLQAGVPYSSLIGKRKASRPWTWSKFAIDRPRAELFDRINARTAAMDAAGMEDEARALLPLRHLNSLNTIGFKEWFAHFDGLMDRATTVARIAKNTRVYAKKQLTWLARRPDTVWLNPSTAADTILISIPNT